MNNLPTLCEFDKPVGIIEVLPTRNERTELGRVVINPPKKMPPLQVEETGEFWYICRACGRSYLCKEKYSQHISEHQGNPMFPISVTPVLRETQHHKLSVQIQIPTRVTISLNLGVPSPEIESIDESLNSSESELLEAETNNKENVDPLICTICDKTFESSSKLKKHIRNHGEKIHKCVHCDSKFVFRNRLKSHYEDVHRKENPFKCPKCTYRLASEKSLKRHCRLHHQATIQEIKDQVQKDRIKRERIAAQHHKARTSAIQRKTEDCATDEEFPCRFCGKVLTQARTLQEHLRLHTGEKPIHCKKCPLKFPRYSSLWSHISTSHSSNNFKCKYCSCGFKVPRSVTVHTKKFHPEKC